MLHKNAALSLLARPKIPNIGIDSPLTTTVCCATITAQEFHNTNSTPMDLIVCLDVSGSMEGNKLKLCKQTLHLLVRVLQSHDRFGLVTYASDVKVNVALTTDKQAAHDIIDQLSTRGCTNISAGIGMAVQEMSRHPEPDRVKTIFLLTDGHANEGISQEDALVEFTRNLLQNRVSNIGDQVMKDGDDIGAISTNNIGNVGGNFFSNIFPIQQQSNMAPQQQQQQSFTTGASSSTKNLFESNITVPPNVSLHCFGYGIDHNASLLRRIAEVSNGNYYFMEQDKNILAAFGDCLGGITSVVAQNCLLDVRAATDGVEIVKVFHENVTKREDGSYSISVGDFYSEETRDILVECTLARPANPDPVPHLQFSLSYYNVEAKALMQSESVTASIKRPLGNEVAPEDEHVAAQWIRVQGVRLMSEADRLANMGKLNEANEVIQQMRAEIGKAPESVQQAPAVEEWSRDLNTLEAGLSSETEYRARGSKMFNMNIRKNMIQRSAVYEEEGEAVKTSYSTTSKAKMMKRFTKGGPA